MASAVVAAYALEIQSVFESVLEEYAAAHPTIQRPEFEYFDFLENKEHAIIAWNTESIPNRGFILEIVVSKNSKNTINFIPVYIDTHSMHLVTDIVDVEYTESGGIDQESLRTSLRTLYAYLMTRPAERIL